MGVENRPYIGTWKLGQKKVVQQTPDALVYINGDLSIPGCPKCNQGIDIQQYVTEVSVEAGVEPGSMSANFTLSVPMHGNEAFIRDAQFVIIPGLEVHVYFRGYFAVKGMYSNLAEEQFKGNVATSGGNYTKILSANNAKWDVKPPSVTQNENSTYLTQDQLNAWATEMGVTPEFLNICLVCYGESNNPSEWPVIVATVMNRYALGGRKGDYYGNSIWQITTGKVDHTGPQKSGNAYSTGTKIPSSDTLKKIGEVVIDTLSKRMQNGNDNDKGAVNFMHTATQNDLAAKAAKEGKSYDNASQVATKWQASGLISLAGTDSSQFWVFGIQNPGAILKDKAEKQAITTLGQTVELTMEPEVKSPPAIPVEKVQTEPSLLAQAGLEGNDIENVLAYPYYQVFHGVIIQVGCTQSSGVQTITVQCQSMLHFWQFQKISTQGGVFGPKPADSGNTTEIMGQKFNGWSPYSIIYHIFHNAVGDAAGISFAITQKTNVDGRDKNGQEMYSIIQKYWQERFNEREIKLRMHGVSGNIFNSIHAAILGRAKNENIDETIKKMLFPAGTQPSSNIDLAVQTFKQRELVTSLFASTGSTRDAAGSFQLNMADSQAYVSDISKWGNISLFQSTYETKMDVAQNVMRVSGFEFYQDVDGDFVFKPPMYNLDTSSSRVYRIEDIDLINLTFDEKEPMATYMLGKGNVVSNIIISGLDNEFGVKGDFYDYRLIAQFGWREGSFETSALTDPVGVQLMAINQMAVLNAGVCSASVTIPLRPEIRPGYPVYISCIDCFYYVTSVSHSFSMGGQCSTTLQLVAKRAKFLPPGDPTQIGIESIDLSKTTLPKKVLKALTPGGQLKIIGFPNVVMAIDPNELDPIEILRGMDFSKLNDIQVLTQIVKLAVKQKILRPIMNSESSTNENPDTMPSDYTISVGEYQGITFSFGSNNKRANTMTFKEAVETYQRAASIREKQSFNDIKIAKLQNQLNVLERQQNKLVDTTEENKKERERLQIEINTLNKKITELANDNKKIQTETGLTDTQLKFANAFAYVLEQMASKYGLNPGYGWDYIGLSPTTKMLDLLNSKKAAFGGDSISGDYRYYSASHPDKDQQGQGLAYIDKNGEVQTNTATVKNPRQITMFEKSTGVLKREDGLVPDVKLTKGQPQGGIKILTGIKSSPEAVVQTSDIYQLSYSPVKNITTAPVTNNKKSTSVRYADSDIIKASITSANGAMNPKASSVNGSTETTLNEMMAEWLATINEKIKNANQAAASAVKVSISATTTITAPDNIPTVGGVMPANMSLKLFSFQDNTENTIPAYTNSAIDPNTVFCEKISSAYGDYVGRQVLVSKQNWVTQIQAEASLKQNNKWQIAVDAFNKSLTSSLGITPPLAQSQQVAKTKTQNLSAWAPVFPVSDSKGYEVFGVLRYGREISIEPNGVFDVLAHQDPMRLLDKATINEVIDNYLKGEPLTVNTTVKRKNASGQDVNVHTKQKLSGPEATDQVEKDLLKNWDGSISDTSLLKLGLAVKTGDPNLIQMNFMNWYADKGKDGIQKLPINNAAYSLSNLKPAEKYGKVCNCRMAEASVLLDSVSQTDFLKYASPGTSIPQALVDKDTDTPTKWVITQNMSQVKNWQASQVAMRGQILDTSSSNLVSVIQNMDDMFEKQNEQITEQGAEALEQSIKDEWNASIENFKKIGK